MINIKYFLISVITIFFAVTYTALADVGFTKQDLELVKDACLAGSSFDFKTEANGSISVKNLEGKGKLSIGKKDVTTVDLPDSDKREEFKEIRSCIKDYLFSKKPKKPVDEPQSSSGSNGLLSGSIVAQCGCWGYVNFGQIGPSAVCVSKKEIAFICTGVCPAGGNSWGTRCI